MYNYIWNFASGIHIMALIIILVCIAIEQFAPKISQFRNFQWLKQYLQWFHQAFPNLDGTISLLLILSPIIISSVILFSSVNTLLWFLLSITVLCYSIGPKNTLIQVTDYCDAAERGDMEAAMRYANELQMCPKSITDEEHLNQHVINTILTNTSERITSILFWFLILGPLGALLYRCNEQISRCNHNSEDNVIQVAAQQLHFILGWLPARLTAFSYALGGNMSDAWKNWSNYQDSWSHTHCDSNCGILICCGLGAIQVEPDSQSNSLQGVQCALALANRAIIIWVSFIAILTLAGFS